MPKKVTSTELAYRFGSVNRCPARCTVPRPNAHLSCDLCPGPAQGAQLGHSRRIHRSARAADQLALGAGHGDARAHALADQLALELGDAGEDAALIRAEVKISPDNLA
jgi:hypothetical protein